MFWSTLWRVIVVPLAFLVSALVSAFVLVTLGMERVTQALHGTQMDSTDSVFAIFDFVSQGFVLATSMTLLPAFIIVLVGEVARIRAVLYYILGGGLALVSVPVLARYGDTADLILPSTLVLQVFATAGFAGGFVYWLLAGRRA